MRFYFYIAPHEVYNDAVIYLAEGLRELGVPFSASRDFWQQDPAGGKFLLPHDPGVRPVDCDLVVFSTYWYNYIDPVTFRATGAAMPPGLTAANRRHRLILLDPDDGYKTTGWRPEFRAFDLVLRPKYNRRTFNHANTVPWVLGYSQRILQATEEAPPFASRTRTIVQNFGFTHGYAHGVRQAALAQLLPRLTGSFVLDTRQSPAGVEPSDPWAQLMWSQTQGKHNPSYFEQLGRAQCVACFCGDFIPGLPFEPSSCLAGGGKARLRLRFYRRLARWLGRTDRIIQWDSWRFWECLAAGSVALHVDLAKYGVALPVMPVNWEHYVGFDFENLDRDILRFLALDTADLARIAAAGRQWALEHYAPAAAGRRVIALAENLPVTPNHA